MKRVWNKLGNIFLKDWADVRSGSYLHMEFLRENLNLNEWTEFKTLKTNLPNIKNLEELLAFLAKNAFVSYPVIIEIAIKNNYWDLVKELSSWQEVEYAYLGKSPKCHLHEAVFEQFLTLISTDNLAQKDFLIMQDLKIQKKYIGDLFYFRLKNMFVEELRIKQFSISSGGDSEKLKVMVEFFFFLRDLDLLPLVYFDSLIEEVLLYPNFFILRYFEQFLNPGHTLLVFSTLKSAYIQEFFSRYANLFQINGYIKHTIQCFMNDCSASGKELYIILDWIREKNLDNIENDNSLIQTIVSSRFHSSVKVPLITALMEFNLVPKNELLLQALSQQVSINPLLLEALSLGGGEKELCRKILGSHSFKTRQKLRNLVANLKDYKKQNDLIVRYIAINKLSINRDILEHWSFEKASFHDLSLELLNKVVFILKFFKPHRQLKLLQGVCSQQSKEIESAYQILTIISNHQGYPYRLPSKPGNIGLLNQELVLHKQYLDNMELCFGIEKFAEELEKRKFYGCEIRVPRTAKDLMMVGKEFSNCLYQTHHSSFVSKILNRQLIIITLHGPKKYCVSFDPYQKRIEEAKIIGQMMMESEVKQALHSFLKELNFGQEWLTPTKSSGNRQ